MEKLKELKKEYRGIIRDFAQHPEKYKDVDMESKFEDMYETVHSTEMKLKYKYNQYNNYIVQEEIEDNIINLEMQLCNTDKYKKLSSDIYRSINYINDDKARMKLESDMYIALRLFGEHAYKMGLIQNQLIK